MYMNRSICRVLAAAVASAGLAVPVPTIGATLSCTSATFTATPDGNGNINVSCSQPSTSGGGTTTPPPVDTPPPPPPPPGGAISCDGFSKTHVIDIAWGATGSAAPRVLTGNNGGFTAGEIVVARFTTPASTAAGVYAQIKSAEWGDQQHQRIASLSSSPCDFSTALGRLAMTSVATTSPAINYAVGGSSSYYAILKPSTTYYFNIKNADCGANESCNMFIELQKPRGL